MCVILSFGKLKNEIMAKPIINDITSDNSTLCSFKIGTREGLNKKNRISKNSIKPTIPNSEIIHKKSL
jgi:hypothetical protein